MFLSSEIELACMNDVRTRVRNENQITTSCA